MADAVPEVGRVTAEGPARPPREPVGGDSASVTAIARATSRVGSKARAMVTAEPLRPIGRATAPLLAAPTEITGPPKPTLLTVRAVGVAAVVPLDGEVGATETGAPGAAYAIPGAPPAGPDVAATLILARLADPGGSGQAAATKGGVGRVLEMVRRTATAGPAPRPAAPARGVGEGRVVAAPRRRPTVVAMGPTGPARLMVMVHAEPATRRLKDPHGAILATCP